MHLSIVTHGRLIGDYHAQHPFVAYTLHDRAGTLASLLYKAEKPSVRLSVRRVGNSVVSACIKWDLHYTIAKSSSMCKFALKSF